MAFKESQYQWMSEATQIKGHEKTKKKLAYQDQQNQKKTKKGMKNFIQSPANQWLLSCNGSQRNQRMKQCQKPLKQEGTRKP